MRGMDRPFRQRTPLGHLVAPRLVPGSGSGTVPIGGPSVLDRECRGKRARCQPPKITSLFRASMRASMLRAGPPEKMTARSVVEVGRKHPPLRAHHATKRKV